MKIVPAPGRYESSDGREDEQGEVTQSCSCPGGVVHASAVPLRDVLDRVGQELARLALLVDRFEVEVGPRILEAAGRDPQLMQRMQGLDQIGQHVLGLVAFLAALAPSAASRCHLDPGPAAAVVTLSDMAARLGFRDEETSSASVDRGDCEFL